MSYVESHAQDLAKSIKSIDSQTKHLTKEIDRLNDARVPLYEERARLTRALQSLVGASNDPQVLMASGGCGQVSNKVRGY